MDAWEQKNQDHWKHFHSEIQQQHRSHIVKGAIMAPVIFVAPFIFMWMIRVILGR
jgi:hypothetical protein